MTSTYISDKGGKASLIGSSINVGWTNVSNISAGTTILLSTDDTAFFEVASAVAGSSTTISNLDLDTQYWVKVLTEGANGESNESSAVSVSTPYTAPTLVILPTSIPTEGQSYGLNLSATYADATPQKDMISSWQIDLGDGQGTKTYNLDTPGDSTIVSGNAYAMNATSATVKITAVDGTGRTIVQPDQTLLLSPPTATRPGGSSIDATNNEITWYGGGDDLPASTNYIVQKLSPGSSTWSDIGAVAAHDFTSTDYGPSYSFTDSNVSTTAIGTDVGQLYRIAAVTSGAADHNAGTPGVSVTDAFHIATSADSFYYSQTVYQPDDTSDPIVYAGLDGVTGSWSPDIGTPNSPTEFGSGQTLTFTVHNLIPHVALDLDLYGSSTGSSTSGDLVTLTGPDTRQVTSTTVNDRFIVAAFSTSTSSATFTLKLDIPGNDSNGNPRTWNISGVYLKCQDGFAVLNDASVDVGGVTNVPITVTANDSDQPLAGDVFTLVNYDHSKIQPVDGDTVTLDANGQGVLPIEGLAVGTTPIVLEDAIGDQAVANVASLAPQVTSTGSEVEGGTYNTGPGDKAGFTFSIPQASQTDVTINFNTSGSTLPAGVLAQLGNSVTIPAGQTSAFTSFTMANDNKVASKMYAVLNLNVAGAAQPPHATLVVDNTNKPTIKVNGQTDGATVMVDLQNDQSLLASIGITVTYHGHLDGTTFSWDPSQDVIWLTDNIGTVGVDDLASMPNVSHDTYGDHYSFHGLLPFQLFAQAVGGSAAANGTTLTLQAKVAKPATQAVPAESTSPNGSAEETQRGIAIEVSGTGMISDSEKGIAGDLMIGARVNLTVSSFGPSDGMVDVDWDIAGVNGTTKDIAIADYVAQSEHGPQVTYLTTAELEQHSLSFYYLSDFAGLLKWSLRDISVNATLLDATGAHNYHAGIALRVWNPSIRTDDSHEEAVAGVYGNEMTTFGTDPRSQPHTPWGFLYENQVSEPNPFSGGSWGYAQLIDYNVTASEKGARYHWSLNTDGYDLDNAFTAPGEWEGPTGADWHSFSDIPSFDLSKVPQRRFVTWTFAAKAYVMYHPVANEYNDAIWVPLESEVWHFMVFAIRVGSDYVGGGSPVIRGMSRSTSQEPEWPDVFHNGNGDWISN